MQPTPEPTIARIERALAFMTYVVDHFGERYAPVRDSLIVDLEAYRRRQPSLERSMPKRLRPLPDRSDVTDDTPLHLDTAARLAFPDGVVTGLALRNAAARGDLEYERLGGRIVTTLRFIKEWRERNRYPAKPSTNLQEPAHLTEEYRAASLAAAYRATAELRAKPSQEKPSEAGLAAQIALKARLQVLSETRSKSRKTAPKGKA